MKARLPALVSWHGRRRTFLDTIQVIQGERMQLEDWIETRSRERARVTHQAAVVRLASSRLDMLPGGQSAPRSARERQLWDQCRKLQATMEKAAERPGTGGLTHVDWSSRSGFWIYPRGHDESGWTAAQQTAYAREVGRLEDLARILNDSTPVEQARFEASQAEATYRAALRRSTYSPGKSQDPRPRRSGVFAAIPFLAFLLASAVGIFFEPTGLGAWIGVGFLLAAVTIGAWGALLEGPRVGMLAGLGASASLALFMAAYIACRALDAESIIRHTADALPVQSIGEVGLVTLTVGLTGEALGTELEGPARIIAFIQILLTISAIVVIATAGWRVLMARTERQVNDEQRLE